MGTSAASGNDVKHGEWCSTGGDADQPLAEDEEAPLEGDFFEEIAQDDASGNLRRSVDADGAYNAWDAYYGSTSHWWQHMLAASGAGHFSLSMDGHGAWPVGAAASVSAVAVPVGAAAAGFGPVAAYMAPAARHALVPVPQAAAPPAVYAASAAPAAPSAMQLDAESSAAVAGLLGLALPGQADGWQQWYGACADACWGTGAMGAAEHHEQQQHQRLSEGYWDCGEHAAYADQRPGGFVEEPDDSPPRAMRSLAFGRGSQPSSETSDGSVSPTSPLRPADTLGSAASLASASSPRKEQRNVSKGHALRQGGSGGGNAAKLWLHTPGQHPPKAAAAAGVRGGGGGGAGAAEAAAAPEAPATGEKRPRPPAAAPKAAAAREASGEGTAAAKEDIFIYKGGTVKSESPGTQQQQQQPQRSPQLAAAPSSSPAPGSSTAPAPSLSPAPPAAPPTKAPHQRSARLLGTLGIRQADDPLSWDMPISAVLGGGPPHTARQLRPLTWEQKKPGLAGDLSPGGTAERAKLQSSGSVRARSQLSMTSGTQSRPATTPSKPSTADSQRHMKWRTQRERGWDSSQGGAAVAKAATSPAAMWNEAFGGAGVPGTTATPSGGPCRSSQDAGNSWGSVLLSGGNAGDPWDQPVSLRLPPGVPVDNQALPRSRPTQPTFRLQQLRSAVAPAVPKTSVSDLDNVLSHYNDWKQSMKGNPEWHGSQLHDRYEQAYQAELARLRNEAKVSNSVLAAASGHKELRAMIRSLRVKPGRTNPLAELEILISLLEPLWAEAQVAAADRVSLDDDPSELDDFDLTEKLQDIADHAMATLDARDATMAIIHGIREHERKLAKMKEAYAQPEQGPDLAKLVAELKEEITAWVQRDPTALLAEAGGSRQRRVFLWRGLDALERLNADADPSKAAGDGNVALDAAQGWPLPQNAAGRAALDCTRSLRSVLRNKGGKAAKEPDLPWLKKRQLDSQLVASA